MRDESKTWQARVGQIIQDKLDYKDLQLWRGAEIVGRVQDENVNAFQCLGLGVKVGAPETVISDHYDPHLKHRDYNGPTYWFDASTGEVNLTDVLKNGTSAVYLYSGESDVKERSNQK